MRVLVACEFSGVVRRAFWRHGHVAWSCDLLEAEDRGVNHYQMGVHYVIENYGPWDMMIAHPPCTHLACSGARWFIDRQEEQKAAIEFFLYLAEANIPKIAIENPIGIMSTRYRKPDQIIQPWMFGHPESKGTCLWLKGLPALAPTENVREQMMKLPKAEANRIHYASPGPNRWKERSRTYEGIADAMAEQWGTR